VTDALFVVDDSRGKVWRVSATVQGVRLGIRIGSARDGKVTAFAAHSQKSFSRNSATASDISLHS
jgi:hypothetical protein